MYYECPDDVIVQRHMEEGNVNEEEMKKKLEDFHSRMTPLMLKYPDKLKIVSFRFPIFLFSLRYL